MSIDHSNGEGETHQDAIKHLTRIVMDLQRTVRLQSTQIQSLEGTVRNQSNEIQTLQDEVRNLERWVVLVAPIPGWGEEESLVNAVKGFVTNFKKQMQMMLRGDVRNEFIRLDAPDDMSPWFDYGILLPYWKELQEAMLRPYFIQTVASSEQSEFRIRGITLDKQLMDVFAPGPRVNHFKTLHFEGNNFGNNELLFLMDLVERNPALKTFSLIYNWFVNGDGDVTENQEIVSRLCNLIQPTLL